MGPYPEDDDWSPPTGLDWIGRIFCTLWLLGMLALAVLPNT